MGEVYNEEIHNLYSVPNGMYNMHNTYIDSILDVKELFPTEFSIVFE